MSRFRTVRISDPRHERNHLRYITVKSLNLKGRGDICLFVPPSISVKNLPIVLLLHGVYGSAFSWSQAAGAHHTTLRLIEEGQIDPMIIAMPSDGLWGDGSGYVRHEYLDFEKWIVDDVLDVIKLEIPEAQDSYKTFIAGLSMGGYGALRLGAKYHDRFNGISAHSALTAADQLVQFVEEPLSAYQYHLSEDLNVINLLVKNKFELPPLRFDCGKDDVLVEQNRKLHEQLEKHNIDHIYEEFEGQHEWVYWEEHLVDTLLFFNNLCK